MPRLFFTNQPGGYGSYLTDILDQHGVAVQHAGGFYSGGQCGDSNHEILCTNISAPSWLAFSGTFDIIHFNSGLHDLANYAPKGQPSTQIPLSQYGANLATIYKRFATKAKKVIWVSTTPVPNVPQAYGRTYELAVDYNKEALTALQSLVAPDALLVNDLWSDFISVCGALYTNCSLQLPANVHLTTAGQEFAAQASAKVILKALGM